MGKTFKEQFYDALKDGKEDKAIFLAQFMKDEINEPYNYRSPLVWAKKYGNEKVIKALSDMGALEVVDKEGMIDELLIKILWRKDIDNETEKRAIELIKDGANLEVKDEGGYTALMKASSRGHVEVVKALLDAGAKVDEKDNDGDTALIYASLRDYVEVVKALLDAGADVTITNNDGATAIDYAGNDEIKKLLNEAMERKKERAKKATQETSEKDVWSKIGKLFGRE